MGGYGYAFNNRLFHPESIEEYENGTAEHILITPQQDGIHTAPGAMTQRYGQAHTLIHLRRRSMWLGCQR